MGDNVSVVRRLFEAFVRKDAFSLREGFAEDAVWTVRSPSVVGGTYRGRREIMRFLGSLPKLTDGTYSTRLIDVLASDDRAAVLYRATGRRQGRELDIDQVLLFTLRDGIVTEVLALPSDQHAFDRFWGS
jgi:ketosteroid isomerase-like protein